VLAIELTGRRALVTGAGRGIGRELALTLGQAGAEVLVNDVDPERCQAVSTELELDGSKATALPFDVSNYEEVQRALDTCHGVDILVNNAGNGGGERFKLAPFDCRYKGTVSCH
jgi:NAD(P)-dependent dehydrogenase (short-subunit alcohol dehydrogenase family)